ncbi:MAG: DUF3800 domain-containing protein [Chloroflexi bacterium]|nr:DUF3800 domain-containing protein [Chloroflexota bacterium]
MGKPGKHVTSVRHYFVDEAGDGTLFNGRGRIIVGTEGCSRFFILGLLDVANPDALALDMDTLRADLLADPYFKGVPSMQPEARKTALAFHAKDDVPEVRREVFKLLLAHSHDLRFFAVVRDKSKVVEYVRQRNERDPSYRYNPNELYDYLVRRLCKNLLHKDDQYNICFAKRGKSDRTAALRTALETARHRFCVQWGITSTALINVIPSTPPACAGLQAVDYLLWALQRLYERREDRYVELLWPAFRLVNDLDDTREARYGVYYSQKKPLTLAALENVPGI